MYFLPLDSLAGSTAGQYGCQWSIIIISLESKVEGTRVTEENWVQILMKKLSCAQGFIPLPCTAEFSELGTSQKP